MKILIRFLSSALLGCLATLPLCAQDMKSNMDVTARLLQQHQKEHADANFCLSPLSLQMAMAMVVNGAEGATQSEILNALGWKGQNLSQVNRAQNKCLQNMASDEDITVHIANSLWVNKQSKSLKRTFRRNVREYFDAEIARLSFNEAATERINSWCSEKTMGKIPTIVNQVEPAAQLYLINALYFKGAWINSFDPENTRPNAFRLTTGEEERVPMMSHQRYYDYAETDLCQMVKMPFRNVGEQSYSLYILLPKEDLTVSALLDRLSGEEWQRTTAQLRSQEVHLTLPKFRLEYTTPLNQTLRHMGIVRAFNASLADFGGISNTPLCIDLVIQKTFFDVTETGAEAAAVTAVAMLRSTAIKAHEVREMCVDHPFLFVLAEQKSGVVLFAGKVEDPR